jgi:MFS family permease
LLRNFRLPSFPFSPAAANPSRTRLDLRAGLGDGASFSLMVGMGETYLAAFALALGLGETAAGLVATVPMLAGALLQLAGPWAVDRLGSHKRWVVLCASCQAASLLLAPLALLGFGSAVFAGFIVFLAATLYWGAGLATGPAWNTWMEAVVPRRVRTRFFASRVRLCQLCLLLGFVGGGLLLQLGSSADKGSWLGIHGWTLAAFTGLFVIAASSRFL